MFNVQNSLTYSSSFVCSVRAFSYSRLVSIFFAPETGMFLTSFGRALSRSVLGGRKQKNKQVYTWPRESVGETSVVASPPMRVAVGRMRLRYHVVVIDTSPTSPVLRAVPVFFPRMRNISTFSTLQRIQQCTQYMHYVAREVLAGTGLTKLKMSEIKVNL